MLRTTLTAVVAAAAFALPALAQKPNQDATQGRALPMAFELDMRLVRQPYYQVKLEANQVFLGVLVGALDPKTVMYPGLLPVLDDPVVLATGVGDRFYGFFLGKVPDWLPLHLQGLGLAVDGQIAATPIEYPLTAAR